MNTKQTKLALISLQVVLLISILANPRTGEAGFLLQKAHVSVINDLRPDLDLTLHCKSKEDDLGVKVLPYGSNFTFVFRPNIQGTTLFFCSMQWKMSPLKHFDIYSGFRDILKCRCSVFKWSIKPEAPCMFNYWSNKFDFCYQWNKN